MEHGADSYLAGLVVTGVHRRNLRICGCGRWKAASAEARKVSVERMEEYVGRVQGGSEQSKSVDESPSVGRVPPSDLLNSMGREVH